MSRSPLSIPRHVVQQRLRPPAAGIPPTPLERHQVLQSVRHYVAEFNPVPPLPLDELKLHAQRVLEMLHCPAGYRNYIAVLINNEIWRETLAAVPFERRLLLLPKCLRVEKKCPAHVDQFGLICKRCGLCSIQDLQAEAESLGYAVLVAEGSAMIMSLLQSGKIDAIIGVSCMNVLERAFPYMEAGAIPGMAIPLLQDDCVETSLDLHWVWDCIHLTSADRTRRLDLSALRKEVDSWFSPESLYHIMGAAEGQTDELARQWLCGAGKRWRPFLAVAAFDALRETPGAPYPDDLRKLAAAIECFHKASLVHDDIEDQDEERYGQKTLHALHGVPLALNIGDLLIGEGYRLLAECNASPSQRIAMLRVASDGHRELCRGQGAELSWTRNPQPLTPTQVLDIFRSKTAPAFEVALKLGALFALDQSATRSGDAAPTAAGTFDETGRILSTFSEALGIAYQIRDDLSDLDTQSATNDIGGWRPSLLPAIAWQRARSPQKELLESWWCGRAKPEQQHEIEAACRQLKADERARLLLETYKEEAVRSLRQLENANLKGLLRRVIGKIFNETEIRAWCQEFRIDRDAIAKGA